MEAGTARKGEQNVNIGCLATTSFLHQPKQFSGTVVHRQRNQQEHLPADVAVIVHSFFTVQKKTCSAACCHERFLDPSSVLTKARDCEAEQEQCNFIIPLKMVMIVCLFCIWPSFVLVVQSKLSAPALTFIFSLHFKQQHMLRVSLCFSRTHCLHSC